MASFLFDIARTQLLNPGTHGITSTTAWDWVDDTIHAVLHTPATDVTPSAALTTYNATNFPDFPDAGAGGSDGLAIAGRTVTANRAMAGASTTFTGVTDINTIKGVVIYKRTAASTGTPIAYLDSDAITGLPITTNGGEITITWDATNGLFRLG